MIAIALRVNRNLMPTQLRIINCNAGEYLAYLSKTGNTCIWRQGPILSSSFKAIFTSDSELVRNDCLRPMQVNF